MVVLNLILTWNSIENVSYSYREKEKVVGGLIEVELEDSRSRRV